MKDVALKPAIQARITEAGGEILEKVLKNSDREDALSELKGIALHRGLTEVGLQRSMDLAFTLGGIGPFPNIRAMGQAQVYEVVLRLPELSSRVPEQVFFDVAAGET